MVALQIQRDLPVVILREPLVQLEAADLEIEQLLGEILFGLPRNFWRRHVRWAVGGHRYVHLRIFRRERSNVHLLFQSGDDLQPDHDLRRAEKRRRACRLFAMQYEWRDFRREVLPVVIETSDLHAAARGRFRNRNDFGSNLVLEPIRLNQEQRGEKRNGRKGYKCEEAIQNPLLAAAHWSASSR